MPIGILTAPSGASGSGILIEAPPPEAPGFAPIPSIPILMGIPIGGMSMPVVDEATAEDVPALEGLGIAVVAPVVDGEGVEGGAAGIIPADPPLEEEACTAEPGRPRPAGTCGAACAGCRPY